MTTVQIRRFEAGNSDHLIDQALKSIGAERAYALGRGRGFRIIDHNGKKSKALTMTELLQRVDEIRVSQGLEPIVRR